MANDIVSIQVKIALSRFDYDINRFGYMPLFVDAELCVNK